MKNFRLFLLCALATVLIPFLTGCSSHSAGTDDLLKYVSADDRLVVCGNINDVARNAGCTVDASGITLSDNVLRLLRYGIGNSDTEVLQDALRNSGIDTEAFVIALKPDDAIILFALHDQTAFLKWLKQCDEDYYNNSRIEENGYTLFPRVFGKSTILVKDGIAAFVSFSTDKAIAAFEARRACAEENPLPRWKKDRLTPASTLSMLVSTSFFNEIYAGMGVPSPMALAGICYDPEEYANSTFAVTGKLDGNDLKFVNELLNTDGAQLVNRLAAKADTGIMKYATRDDMAMVILAIPQDVDWYDIIRKAMIAANPYEEPSMQDIAVVASVLDKVDNTVMVAGGLVSPMFFNRPQGWHIVAAAQMKEGAAEDYIGTIQLMCEMYDVPCRLTDDALEITIPEGITLYVKAIGNDLVASTAVPTAAGGCPIPESIFRGSCGGAAVVLPSDNSIVNFLNLPFGVQFTVVSGESEAQATLSLTGTDGNLLENIINYAAGIF